MFKKNTTKTYKMQMDEKATEVPKIYIKYEAALKMNQIINTCDAEVGWLGSVEENDGAYTITDVYLLKQRVNGATCELDENALSDLLCDMVQNKPEEYNKIKLWGHSHVDMAVNPSGQDDETFTEYYQDNPYFIRLIANKKEEMRIDIAIKDEGYVYYNVPWEMIYPMDIIEAMEVYAEACDLMKEAEESITKAKNSIECVFKNDLDKEIKDKVVKMGSSKDDKKDDKKSTYQWTDYDMEDYGSWYDNYGYGYSQNYTDMVENIMPKCDAGIKVKYMNDEKSLTDAFDGLEILELAETCASWKDLKDELKGDPRVFYYDKPNWTKLYKSINETYKNFERRMYA